MKKQFLLCTSCILSVLLFLTACTALPPVSSESSSANSSRPDISLPSNSTPESSATTDSDSSEMQFYDGRIGDKLSTAFFDFTVDSVELAENIPAEQGMMILDVVITVKNTFGDQIPMFYNDFQMQYGEGDYDCCYNIIDETVPADTVPEQYTLKRAETATYHYYFSVPQDATDFAVAYLEVYDDDSTGDAFFIYFERQ